MTEPDDVPPALPGSPVFVVGAERSGSTMLRIMLDGHPDIACIGQFEYAVDLIGPDGTPPTTGTFLAFLETDRVFNLHGLRVDPALDQPALVRDFLEQDRRRKNAAVAMGVVHRNFEHLPALWPEARYLHLLRDPRDVARSAVAMGWAGDTWHGVVPWLHAEEQWDRLVAELGDGQWMEVRYEDLVGDHEATLERICAFIGVEFRLGDLLGYARETDYALPDPSLRVQWRTRATPDDIARCEARAGALMEARGYERSEVPPWTPQPRELGALARRNRWAKRRARIRRFGLWWTLADAVTRGLRLRGPQRRVAQRMNAIENRGLKKSWRGSSPTAGIDAD